MNLSERMSELGLTLPPRPAALASYVPAVVSGRGVVVSGQLPLVDGKLVSQGQVGGDVSLEDAQAAARVCVLNGLAAVDGVLEGDWSRFERVERLGVFVASAGGFVEQHLVANGASDLLAEVFGEAGRHARAAVGVPCLPLGASVEVEMRLVLR